MAEFPEHIERWRPVIAWYFPPEQVDRMLAVMLQETSTGEPFPGLSYGLFQYHDSPGIALASEGEWLNPEDEDAYWYELMTGEKPS